MSPNLRTLIAASALLQMLFGSFLHPVHGTGSPAARPQGLVAEEIAPGSAAERAGLQPGDELAAWSGERGGSGVLRTPFDLAEVGIEQAPRGTVTLQGSRGGEEKSWSVPPGIWGIEARPALEPDLLELYERGRRRIASGDLDTGTRLWRSALEFLERQVAEEDASWLEGRLAEVFAAAGRWPEADTAWERAVRRLEPQWASGAAQLLRAWGETLQQRNVWEHAEACHRRALRLVPAESLAASRELSALGTIARHGGDLAAAEDLLHKGYSIREKLAPESLDFASSVHDLATLAALRGDLAVAEKGFSQALETRQRLAPDGIEAAGTLISLGFIASRQSDLATAKEHLGRAIYIIERLNPDHPELARALSSLGHEEMSSGELASAEEHFRRALVIRQKLVPESLDVASSLQNLGLVAEKRGDFAAGEEYHRRSLKIREKLTPGSPHVAESLANLGVSERRKGNLPKADEYLQRALAIHDGSSPESFGATQMRIERAVVAVERGDLALAEELYGRALAIFEKQSPGSLRASDILEGLGTIAFERGDLTKAEELFRLTLAIREKLAPSSTRMGLSLNHLGHVYRERGRLAIAAEHFCRATEAFDQQRKKLGGTIEERAAFGGSTAEPYRDCLGALVDLGRVEEAFRILEQGRARSFLDLLAERDLRWTADLEPALARDRKHTETEYDRAQAALGRLSPVRDQAEIDRLLVQLRELRARQKEIAAKVRQASSRAAALLDPRPLDLAGTRAALDPGTVLLSWSIGRKRSFLVVVQPERTEPGLEVFPLAVGDQTLRERVGSFLNLLQRAGSDRAALSRQAQELYDLLLGPAEARISAASRLLISPDGPLHALPFAALVRDGRYLAEGRPIHTVISATIYAELKRFRRGRASRPQVEFAAFGDPSYPPLPKSQSATVDPDIRAALDRGLAMTPLPSTREEVLNIAAFYPEARTFLGADATEDRAKSVSKDARYLHFACHGLFDERFPLNSALALTIPENPREGEENGLLQAWEIFESFRLDADLVTLSACDSGRGKEMGGEGLLGLTRAFQYAGARSVLASLWSVADDSTADLMKRFYGHLRQGRSKDEALRAAQIELIRSKDFSHPYHWAAFQLTGDWQ